MMRSRLLKPCEMIAIAIWIGIAIAGFAAWETYDTTPGIAPKPAASLTLFVHPHCPCSKASLEAFAGLLEPGLLGRVVFVCPEGVDTDWHHGELWERAITLPVTVVIDVDGREATAARATTSGFAVLTDDNGAVTFRGGLTRARGRSGDAAGQRAVRLREAANCPVFGCPLLDEAQ